MSDTGKLTPRAAATMGGLGGRGSLAPRSALAAGSARPMRGSPMDTASRDARAKATGFLRDKKTSDLFTFYHGMNREISPGLLLNPPERATNAASAETGIWASNQSPVSQRYAEEASQRGGSQSILPLRARATRVAEIRLGPGISEMAVKGVILDAWDAGFDAVKTTNYATPDGSTPPVNWVFRDPSQLRSSFAAFDPAKRDSSDLLAGFAVPGPAPVPGFNVQPEPEPVTIFRLPTGGVVDEAIVPNHLRPRDRRVY